jgi:hypothetical protein
MKVAPRLGAFLRRIFATCSRSAKKPRLARPLNPDEAQFDDLEYRDLLRAGRAGYGYGFSALHLGLADLFGPQPSSP